MRTIIMTIVLAASVIFLTDAKPMKKHQIEFHVDGTCKMCKERIESALDVKGISFAEWSPKTEQCTVVYNDNKITEMEIHQILADIGHSTDKVEAKDSAYKALPGCCRYDDDNVHSH